MLRHKRFPQKMRHQRRLYGIISVYFLPVRFPELISFFFKCSNQIKSNQTVRDALHPHSRFEMTNTTLRKKCGLKISAISRLYLLLIWNERIQFYSWYWNLKRFKNNCFKYFRQKPNTTSKFSPFLVNPVSESNLKLKNTPGLL